ncbi:metal dependent phosphohydrolase [Candidatus Koribacter versatilis Ellin345]|uniref:Metal dependent phosphohydrolase n=1 Tax=Koribacter versatilis (strain Ellin345) TaxID=204669 RepID=Q1ISG9_KORVE|nr:HD-GYP domain-containing protein [Candidatus Koribacter versatilis]ABF40181.1 metal dependent phosphohydrolase [Candidatus Koribacter versatilis Ellin345]
MQFTTAVVKSKVARRILLLFIGCALLPVTVLAVLSFYQVSSQLREQSLKQLQHSSKSEGMAIFHNLEMADTDLQLLVSEAEPSSKLSASDLLAKHFLRVGAFGPSREAQAVLGNSISMPDLTEQELHHLGTGKALLRSIPCRVNAGMECLLMLRKSKNTNLVVAGELDLVFVFEARTIPPGLDMCVFSADRAPIFCPAGDAALQSNAAGRFDHSSDLFSWRSGSETYDAAYWKLLITPSFFQQSWTIVVSANRQDVLAPMARFRQSFPLLILLVFWVVLLLSLVQIRRTLGPLERLEEATKQIAGRDFKISLDVHSGDEFENLADSFNEMARQLEMQFKAMEELHWGTLTALARAIDAKSDWTAGHSERVTVLATSIGRRMGLSPEELNIMHMGGLLHDIGKIGTPPDVLDKPGKLTPDEMLTMMSHVQIGVRILEPIAGFRKALSIVSQHHEWYDGTGYPNKLKGEEISLHARIFAVADCFDALTSDRPYRKGLPTVQTLAIMKSQSGTHFDPAVLIVFLEMMAEKEETQLVASTITN